MHAIINRFARQRFTLKAIRGVRDRARLHRARFNRVKVFFSFIRKFNLRFDHTCIPPKRLLSLQLFNLKRIRAGGKLTGGDGIIADELAECIDFSLRRLNIKSLINQTGQYTHYRSVGNFRIFIGRVDFAERRRWTTCDTLKARDVLYNRVN